MEIMSNINGCAFCDIVEREHFSRYASEVGQHRFVMPADAQRKARILARALDNANIIK